MSTKRAITRLLMRHHNAATPNTPCPTNDEVCWPVMQRMSRTIRMNRFFFARQTQICDSRSSGPVILVPPFRATVCCSSGPTQMPRNCHCHWTSGINSFHPQLTQIVGLPGDLRRFLKHSNRHVFSPRIAESTVWISSFTGR